MGLTNFHVHPPFIFFSKAIVFVYEMMNAVITSLYQRK